MKIQLYTTFEDARAAWLKLEQDGLFHPFQRYAWLSHWFATIGGAQGIEPCIVTVAEDGGEPFLLLPMGIRQRIVRRLEWLGGDVTDYHAPLLHRGAPSFQPEGFAKLWREVKSRIGGVDVVNMARGPARIADRDNPFLLLPGCEPAEISFTCTLGEEWESWYASRVTTKLRADSRRRLRRLEELGELSFFIAESEAEKQQVYDVMRAQKERRYTETGARNFFASTSHADFYAGVPAMPDTQLSALRLGDQLIATHMGMYRHDRFYHYMPTFDDEFGKYSPGRLLTEWLLQWAIGHGLKYFDFTVGDEAYKTEWSDVTKELYRVLEPVSAAGRAYLFAKRTSERLSATTRLVDRLNARAARVGEKEQLDP